MSGWVGGVGKAGSPPGPSSAPGIAGGVRRTQVGAAGEGQACVTQLGCLAAHIPGVVVDVCAPVRSAYQIATRVIGVFAWPVGRVG